MDLSAGEIVLIVVVSGLGATLQGVLGFGANVVAAPILVLIDERFIPVPLLIGVLGVALVVAYQHRDAIDFGGMGWALVGRVPGVVLGAAAVLALSTNGLAVLLAASILLAVGVSVTRIKVRRTRPVAFAAGLVSGFGGTATSVGGPPLALIYQDVPGPQLRGTMSGFFLVGASLSLAVLGAVGEIAWSDVALGATVLPGFGIGLVLAARLAPILDRGYIRPLVLAVSTASAVALLIRVAA